MEGPYAPRETYSIVSYAEKPMYDDRTCVMFKINLLFISFIFKLIVN